MEWFLTLILTVQAASVILENDYVKVTRNAAPCAKTGTAGCAERVIVALAPAELRTASQVRKLNRGDIAAFKPNESYTAPAGASWVEVAFKPRMPAVESPPVRIAPEKNSILFDGGRFFVFEEKLSPGDTRQRHSHSQRVVIVLNDTRLQQWPEGGEELLRTQIPDDIRFNPPVIHVVKNVGEKPLRNIVIELKPDRK